MRWLVRESRLLSVLGCEELKLTGRSMNLEGQTAASRLRRKPRVIQTTATAPSSVRVDKKVHKTAGVQLPVKC